MSKKEKMDNDNEKGFEWLTKPVRRVFSLTYKEIRILLNDKIAMVIVFLMPVVIISLLVWGVADPGIKQTETSEDRLTMEDNTLGGAELPVIGIIDLDTSDGFPGRDLSQEFMDKFIEASENGECILYVQNNQSELEYMIGIGEIDAYLVIPQLFEFNLSIHIPVIIPFVIDTIKTLKIQPVQALVDDLIYEFKQENGFTGVFNSVKYNENLPEKNQILFIAAPFLSR